MSEQETVQPTVQSTDQEGREMKRKKRTRVELLGDTLSYLLGIGKKEDKGLKLEEETEEKEVEGLAAESPEEEEEKE